MPDLNFEALNAGAAAIPAAVRANTEAFGSLIQNAKVSDMMVKANPDLPGRMGMTPEQYQTLSAQDKVAATTGYMKAQGVKEMLTRIQSEQAQAAEGQARAGYFQAFAQERKTQAQQQAQDDLAASRYASMLDQQINSPDPNNAAAVDFAKKIPAGVKFQIHAAAQMGRSDPRTSAAMIRPLMQYFSGPGGQGGADVAPQPIKDAQGNVIATPAPNGKGGYSWIKAAKPTSTVKVTDPVAGTTIELPLDEAEARGYVNPRAGTKTGGGAGSPGAPPADPADIKWLTDNPDPDHVAAFEAKYGAGSAAQFTNPNPQAAAQ